MMMRTTTLFARAQMTSHSIMTVVAAAGLAVLLASPANAAERKKERQYVSPNTGW
jgi:hypothetical protein